ncbi:protein kinase byr2-like [Acropora millepora]|uniref:protein kinase byr2-like n=1 Tax=Acropora millepora TaxID=45264 RepID=UPI001CF1E07E|nr:protein kinase byr2-like [Acropora millepora]
MEYMEGGTLQQHIERRRKKLPVIAEETCFVFVRDILKGLAFLNSKGLEHGDIKGDNVLLVESCTHVKLADFGLSRKIEEHVDNRDVWKTGCLHIEMLNGGRSSLHDGFVFGGGQQGERSVIPGKHFPSQATKKTKEFLRLIFGVDREHLPSAAEMLHDAPIFK